MCVIFEWAEQVVLWLHVAITQWVECFRYRDFCSVDLRKFVKSFLSLQLPTLTSSALSPSGYSCTIFSLIHVATEEQQFFLMRSYFRVFSPYFLSSRSSSLNILPPFPSHFIITVIVIILHIFLTRTFNSSVTLYTYHYYQFSCFSITDIT